MLLIYFNIYIINICFTILKTGLVNGNFPPHLNTIVWEEFLLLVEHCLNIIFFLIFLAETTSRSSTRAIRRCITLVLSQVYHIIARTFLLLVEHCLNIIFFLFFLAETTSRSFTGATRRCSSMCTRRWTTRSRSTRMLTSSSALRPCDPRMRAPWKLSLILRLVRKE